jgi:two-component sensor histidine kinase
MNYKVCSVMLVDPDTNELVIKAVQSEHTEYANKPNLKVGESIAGRAAAEGRVLTVLDVKKNKDYRFPDVAQRAGLCSLVSVPLQTRGQVIGVLNCYTDRQHQFGAEEIAILQALGAQAALAIEAAKLMVKSAVIQELHHRVKNNLQQIASLVRLQSHFSKYTTVEAAMNDTLNRILAIAAVHELLSRDDLDTVSMNRVIEQILHGIRQSVLPPSKHVAMSVEGADIRLSLSQATTLALVANELVQNAVEHGFSDVDEGRICVRLSLQDDVVEMDVANNGKPLPPDFDPAQSASLGLRIVNDLVRGGLGGSFTMRHDGGITATVRFPRQAPGAP